MDESGAVSQKQTDGIGLDTHIAHTEGLAAAPALRIPLVINLNLIGALPLSFVLLQSPAPFADRFLFLKP